MRRSTRIGGKFAGDSVDCADDRYVFDEVLNQEATQSMVFERTAKPLLPGVLEGYNATIFAYGVSPSGSSYELVLMARQLDAERHIRSVVKREMRESLSDPWNISLTNSRKTRKRTIIMSNYLLSRFTTKPHKISCRIQTPNAPAKACRY